MKAEDGRTVRFLFDMDGVLCKWNTEASVEDTYEEGYFRKVAEDVKIREVIRQLVDDDYEVCFLSAVYQEGTAKSDKDEWLLSHGYGSLPAIFVPYGEDKSKYVDDEEYVNILIDDFTQNLLKWKDSGKVGVKYYNGINGTHGCWSGYGIPTCMGAKEAVVLLRAIAQTTA